MKLYIKQHIFTWGDQFSVYDTYGNEKYLVEGEVFSFGKKLHVTDLSGKELAFIYQKLFSFIPRYYINRNGKDIAEVIRNFSFFNHEYTVDGLDWSVEGDFFAHEYEVRGGGKLIARIYKEWFTWGDAYVIDIDSMIDEVMVLSVVLVIDAVISNEND